MLRLFLNPKDKNFHKAMQVVLHSLEIPKGSSALKMPKLVNGAKEKIIMYRYCAVLEKVHIPASPWKVIGNSQGEGSGSLKYQNFKSKV